jgi:DNA-binding NarL/FixJ family response regulator
MIRILIADDQKLIRDGIKVLLTTCKELEVVGTANNGLEAIKKIETLQPDLVLLDIEMPFTNGITICNLISIQFQKIKTIILSSHEEKEYIRQAIKAGAKGYLLKDTSIEELERAIHLVHQGYSIFESQLLEKLVKRNIKVPTLKKHHSISLESKKQQPVSSIKSESLTTQKHEQENPSDSSYVILPQISEEIKTPIFPTRGTNYSSRRANNYQSRWRKRSQMDILQMWVFGLAVLCVALILLVVILLYQ